MSTDSKSFKIPRFATLVFLLVLLLFNTFPTGPSQVFAQEVGAVQRAVQIAYGLTQWVPYFGGKIEDGAEALGIEDYVQGSCQGALGIFDGLDACFDTILAGVAGFFFGIAGWLVDISSFFLDITIAFSITNTVYQIPGVFDGWEIFRDLANLTFLFILLYIASMIIVGLDTFDTRKMLITLVVVALLVNFSFFITGMVIDAGNIATSFLYNSMTQGDTTNSGLGGVLQQRLQITTLRSADGDAVSELRQAGTLFMGTIVLLIAAFVFISASLLFVGRTIALIFILILSPLAFAAAILPKTQRFWEEWLGKLVGNAFFGVVFMLLIGVVLLITEPGSFLGTPPEGGSLFAAALNTSDTSAFRDGAMIVLNYVIIIGFLLASLSMSKKMAASTATLTSKFAGQARKYGGRVGRVGRKAAVAGTFGGAAYAYRNTLGRKAALELQTGKLQNIANDKKSSPAQQAAARARVKTLQQRASSSGDVRNNKIVAGVAGAVGLNLGKGGGKGGAEKKIEDAAKKEEKFLKSLNMTDSEKESYAETNLKDSSNIVDQRLYDKLTRAPEKSVIKAHNEEVDTTVTKLKTGVNAIGENNPINFNYAAVEAAHENAQHNIDRAKKDIEEVEDTVTEAKHAVTEAKNKVEKPKREFERLSAAYGQARGGGLDREEFEKIKKEMEEAERNLDAVEKTLHNAEGHLHTKEVDLVGKKRALVERGKEFETTAKELKDFDDKIKVINDKKKKLGKKEISMSEILKDHDAGKDPT